MADIYVSFIIKSVQFSYEGCEENTGRSRSPRRHWHNKIKSDKSVKQSSVNFNNFKVSIKIAFKAIKI